MSCKDDTKGYILYDLTSNKFFVTRNVIFYKSVFLFKTPKHVPPSSPTEHATFLSFASYEIFTEPLPNQTDPLPNNQPYPLPWPNQPDTLIDY